MEKLSNHQFSRMIITRNPPIVPNHRWLTILLLLPRVISSAQAARASGSLLSRFDLAKEEAYHKLLTSHSGPTETVCVIPETAYAVPDAFEYNSHIHIVDNRAGYIKRQFSESAATSGGGLMP